MNKKLTFALFFIFITFLITNISFASYSTVTMSVVEEPVCTINIGENSKFEKKLVSKDLTNKEVTLQLKVTNEEISEKPTGEIVLVLDNSESMNHNTSTSEIRKKLVYNSAKTLITNLLKDNTQLKIGVVKFSTNTDSSKIGTLEDANLVSPLSNSVATLTSAIDNIQANGDMTDLEAGLEFGKTQFTSENNSKYLIVLTDGVPNVAINYDKFPYSDDVISKTKSKLQQLGNSNINIITMLTGIENEDANASRFAPNEADKTYKQIITEIFGTTQNPTAGQFYYITDDKIQGTVETIYNSLVSTDKIFKNLKIVDYFPKEIIDNFDFAYVSKANIGNISASIDKTNNSITWNIPELAVGQTATVQYKLRLKENFDSSIVDKIINTNEKVDITYTDYDGSTIDKTSNVTPKLKLVEPPTPVTPTPPTTPKKEVPSILPKAGLTPTITLIFISLTFVLFFAGKILMISKKIKK